MISGGSAALGLHDGAEVMTSGQQADRGADMNPVRAVPALPVADIHASATFYRDVLGFQAAYQDKSFAILRKGPVDLHLWLAADQEWTNRISDSPVVSGAESFLSGTASCRIQVLEVDRLYEGFKMLGVIHPNGSLESTDWGTREFSVLDPDGNLIVLYAEAQDAA